MAPLLVFSSPFSSSLSLFVFHLCQIIFCEILFYTSNLVQWWSVYFWLDVQWGCQILVLLYMMHKHCQQVQTRRMGSVTLYQQIKTHKRVQNERYLIRTRQNKVHILGKFCLRYSNVRTDKTDVKQQRWVEQDVTCEESGLESPPFSQDFALFTSDI